MDGSLTKRESKSSFRLRSTRCGCHVPVFEQPAPQSPTFASTCKHYRVQLSAFLGPHTGQEPVKMDMPVADKPEAGAPPAAKRSTRELLVGTFDYAYLCIVSVAS
jgi:hypothetical protein